MGASSEHTNAPDVPYLVDYHDLETQGTLSHGRAFSVCFPSATGGMHSYALFPYSRLYGLPVQPNLQVSQQIVPRHFHRLGNCHITLGMKGIALNCGFMYCTVA